MHTLTYTYTQKFEHGISQRKTVTFSNYEHKEPQQVIVLLKAMGTDLKSYVARQYAGYTLVQVN